MLCRLDSRFALFLASCHCTRGALEARRAAPTLSHDCRSSGAAALSQGLAGTSRSRQTAVAEGHAAFATTEDRRGGHGPGTRNHQPRVASSRARALVTD